MRNRVALTLIALLMLAPATAGAAQRVATGKRAVPGAIAAERGQLRATSTTSFGTRFTRYRQYVGGLPVLGASAVVTAGKGSSGDLLLDSTRRIGATPPAGGIGRVQAIRAAERRSPGRRRGPASAAEAILPGPVPHRVWRVLLPSEAPVATYELLVDSRTGAVLRSRDLISRASATAKLFDPNPVVFYGSRTGLADAADADSAKLDGAQVAVTLPRMNAAPCLSGTFVAVRLPSGPVTCPAGNNFTSVTRSADAFEALMAYFHIDRQQAYIQSLGFTDVNNRPIPVTADEIFGGGDDEDNSFYDPADGGIHLGTGSVDDGEDGEVITHEYGHAIQDDQVPGFRASDEGKAMGEGFGDYISAAMNAVAHPPAPSVPGPPEPVPGMRACFAEWDSNDLAAVDLDPQFAVRCLRRVDHDFTVAQAREACVAQGFAADEEHCVGEAWSGALWDIRSQIGGANADRLVIQSHFSLTADADFQAGSVALLAADQALYGGTHVPFLRDLLTQRGLLNPARLDDSPLSAATITPPASLAGTVATAGDAHDVFGIALTAGHGIVASLAGQSDVDLRILRPGAISAGDGFVLARADSPGPKESLSFVATQTGVHYIDVMAAAGSGPYTLDVHGDRDGDGVADETDNCVGVRNPSQAASDGDRFGNACDNCPRASNFRQTNWDRDTLGDACDRSAKVSLKKLRARGRTVVLRATLRPTLLTARSFGVRLERRACRTCRFRLVRTRTATRKRAAGSFDVTLKLPRAGAYRVRATLKSSRYVKARSRAVSLRAR